MLLIKLLKPAAQPIWQILIQMISSGMRRLKFEMVKFHMHVPYINVVSQLYKRTIIPELFFCYLKFCEDKFYINEVEVFSNVFLKFV